MNETTDRDIAQSPKYPYHDIDDMIALRAQSWKEAAVIFNRMRVLQLKEKHDFVSYRVVFTREQKRQYL